MFSLHLNIECPDSFSTPVTLGTLRADARGGRPARDPPESSPDRRFTRLSEIIITAACTLNETRDLRPSHISHHFIFNT